MAFLEAALAEVSTTTLHELSLGLAQLEAGTAYVQSCTANQANPPNIVPPAAPQYVVECGKLAQPTDIEKAEIRS
ncbi:hypothetical protein [Cupriavidus taiwanensis]|uniref:hypothetical protein n=1 Tax=Cupriavidus taiwanensis TaxID=164546 RepID=UPI0021611ED7|nr:hypothetical protein [Cupriavidus taiwanensis]